MDIAQLNAHYRPNVGVVLFNRYGRVWYGKRVGHDENAGAEEAVFCWQMPQGGVDDKEDIIAAAYRELKEETGASKARLLALTTGWLAYDFPKAYKKDRWKGQRQKWAAMLYEGEDSDFDLCADDHQEFDDWRWGELEDAPGLIVPFKRPVYEEMVAAYLPLRNFLRVLHKTGKW